MKTFSSLALFAALIGTCVTSNVQAHCVGSHSIKYGYPECESHDEAQAKSIPLKVDLKEGAKAAACSSLPLPPGTCDALDQKNWKNGAAASISSLLTGSCGTGAVESAKQMAALEPGSDCDKVVSEIERRNMFIHVK